MNSTVTTRPTAAGTTGTSSTAGVRTTPRPLRRVALGVTGFLTAALPVVWGAGTLLELVGGAETEHRFHQLTGQGLLLVALWLAGPAGLLRAGWAGRRPSPVAGWTHLAFVAATLLAAAFVPGQGVVFVAGLVLVTGALLWCALPQRPMLATGLRADLLATPLGLLPAAALVPFVVGQAHEQAHAHDEHAALTHYFDMAWVALVVVALGVLAAVVPAARPLLRRSGFSLLVLGLAAVAFTPLTTLAVACLVLGSAQVAADQVRRARPAADGS